MLKEFLFENAPAILKYLFVVIIAWLVFIFYIAKLNVSGPSSEVVGAVTGGVRDVMPTAVADPQTVAVITSNSSFSSDTRSASSEIHGAFRTANDAIRQGDSQSAMRVLVRLITQYPELPEPYANLASLQAADGQLSEARATLLQGLQANKGYAALFSNLQKVQGALAANAYRSALADQGEAITEVALPVLENIDLSEASQLPDGLNQELQVAENQSLEGATVESPVAEQELKVNK